MVRTETMKSIFICTLCIILLLGLSACAATAPKDESTTTASLGSDTTTAPSEGTVQRPSTEENTTTERVEEETTTEPPKADPFDQNGFPNLPEDDETKRY